MKISIFGLGYVGVVTAACLTKAGHEVWGVDVNSDKVEIINAGRCPIIEPGLEELIHDGHNRKMLQATTDAVEAVLMTDISLICVGTPSKTNGSLDLHGVELVSRQIGEAIRRKNGYHCVVLRSTVLPGTTRNVVIPALETASKKQAHKDFDVCFNPEFLREGSSIKDFYHPPFTAIGQENDRGGDLVASLYSGVEGPLQKTSYEVAEMVKYACNAYHALKVTFANELGVLCKSLGIDSHRVMELFVLDKKLNVSAAYLRPGFAFGGSCLPKDLKALMYKAKEKDLEVPVLGAVMESNRLHIQRVIDQIAGMRRKRLGFLGLSFKAGTDDLRESPIVPVIESLIGKGFTVRIYDADVHLARIFGANKKYIEQEIPHISTLMHAKIDDVIRESDVIVISKLEKEYTDALTPYLGSKTIIDLVRLPFPTKATLDHYDGICW
jgi:GDP-mannose 6-dehydrogenase